MEISEVNHNCLNSALKDFSSLLNQHFAASGNKIFLQDEKDDSYDAHKGVTKHEWLIRASVEWVKVPKHKQK